MLASLVSLSFFKRSSRVVSLAFPVLDALPLPGTFGGVTVSGYSLRLSVAANLSLSEFSLINLAAAGPLNPLSAASCLAISATFSSVIVL